MSHPSPSRVADLHQAALITPEWLLSLATHAEKNEDPVTYVPTAARVLRSLARSVELGNVDPFPTSDLWEYLTDRHVDPLETELLREFPPPRPPRKPKRTPLQVAMQEFERVAGKSVVYRGLWEGDPDADKWSGPLLKWAKALTGLRRFIEAQNLYDSEVRKVLVDVEGAEASWRPGGVLRLSLGAGAATDPSTLVHEMGHALEDKLGLVVTAWSDDPYGKEPFISDMATVNAAEDFAETFRAWVVEPMRLKRVAPSKWADMRDRV